MTNRKNKNHNRERSSNQKKRNRKAKPLLVITAMSLSGMSYGCNQVSNPNVPLYDSGLDSSIDDASVDQDAQVDDAATYNDAGTQ
ncbi:MAG: hypothetical protein IPJ88_02270 [Myxococcales bacterium]|nr:MAG: hypothetical protein IPJ88_02270 [Myxococcales bacterium]